MTRASAGEVAGKVFTEDHRLRRELRSCVLTEVRCARGHLLAMVLGFPAGRWGAWRAPVAVHTASGGWQCAWTDDDANFGVHFMRCVCGGHWIVDLAILRTRGGTVRPSEILADPQPPRFVTHGGRS